MIKKYKIILSIERGLVKMKYAIAVKGADISKDIGCCESFLIFDDKFGKIIMRQNIENSKSESQILPDFLSKFKIKAIVCGNMYEDITQAFTEKGIRVITDVSGNADKFAEVFSASTKKQGNFKSCLQPTPKILVSCRGLNGENNVLAVGYCGNCSYDPPMVMVGIVPSRYSYQMIKESGCFTVNLVDKSYKEVFDYLGSHSKRDENKLDVMNVKFDEGVKIDAPILSDCPVNIECKVVDSVVTGSHEMFIGKVLYVHANAKLVDDEGNIDFSQINFI